MAILFSKVSLKADDGTDEFLIGGAPSDEDELSGWAPYDDFIESLTDEAEIEVYVESYLYGEGETVRATPEEVAYMQMRMDSDEDFLSKHCDNISDCSFNILHEPEKDNPSDSLKCEVPYEIQRIQHHLHHRQRGGTREPRNTPEGYSERILL